LRKSSRALGLRTPEWVLIYFFGYVAAVAPFFRDRPVLKYQPVFVLAGVFVFLWAVARAEGTRFAEGVGMARDCLPLILTLGAFREPNVITGNLQVTYDISPRVSAQLTLANVFHNCFGGTKAAWSSAYAPGQAVCGYVANGNYVGNYQNGAGQLNPGNPSAYDPNANGGVSLYNWQLQSYRPLTGSPAANGAAGAQLPLPFNAYFQVNVKL